MPEFTTGKSKNTTPNLTTITVKEYEESKKQNKDTKYDFKFKLGKLWKNAPILVEKIEIKYLY